MPRRPLNANTNNAKGPALVGADRGWPLSRHMSPTDCAYDYPSTYKDTSTYDYLLPSIKRQLLSTHAPPIHPHAHTPLPV